ncbi:hypothetical protein L195_g048915, partial [Trifolium pratense]
RQKEKEPYWPWRVSLPVMTPCVLHMVLVLHQSSALPLKEASQIGLLWELMVIWRDRSRSEIGLNNRHQLGWWLLLLMLCWWWSCYCYCALPIPYCPLEAAAKSGDDEGVANVGVWGQKSCA